MSYNLFLDDMRVPEDCFEYTHQPVYLMEDWVVVTNYEEFVMAITERGLPDMISFDHDLGDEHYGKTEILYDQYTEKTGYHCAKWLLEYIMDHELELPQHILIHSMNPVGSKNIESLFKTYFKVYGK